MVQLGARDEWSSEVTAFARAFGGAFLFGIPLLYTMEMWWIGEYADLWKLAVFLGLAFLANLGLVSLAGFKREHPVRLSGMLDQAIDAVAVGVVGGTVVLFVLNRFRPDDPLDSIVGMIIVQAVPLSIGASLAGAVFIPEAGKDRVGQELPEYHEWTATLNDIGATMIGGTLIGFTIAPTEEVEMLAAELQLGHELALVALTLIVGYVIVFVSGFDPQAVPAKHPGPLQHPITETTVAYLVSLLVAFVALYLFDQIEFGEPFIATISQVLVLGLPVMVGGAAGRLAV